MCWKTPVVVVALPLDGAAVKRPACTVPACLGSVRPGSVTVSTGVQCVPSAESYPVIVSRSRTSRSQRGADADTLPGRPGVSLT